MAGSQEGFVEGPEKVASSGLDEREGDVRTRVLSLGGGQTCNN